MQYGNLGVVEKKVLGAMMILANEVNVVKATITDIAETMGYKTTGGAITYALRVLERDNFVARLPQKRTYKLLI